LFPTFLLWRPLFLERSFLRLSAHAVSSGKPEEVGIGNTTNHWTPPPEVHDPSVKNHNKRLPPARIKAGYLRNLSYTHLLFWCDVRGSFILNLISLISRF
jgi:hypothetical protein